MAETKLIIGIDTGGTYNDDGVIDGDAHKIVATDKTITTKGDLAIGVGEALRWGIAWEGALNAARGNMDLVNYKLTPEKV